MAYTRNLTRAEEIKLVRKELKEQIRFSSDSEEIAAAIIDAAERETEIKTRGFIE